jgi:hypothetical protein
VESGRELGRSPQLANTLRLQLAVLAIELTALVDEMEAEWRERGILSDENARHLHALRERADRLTDDDS